MTSPQPNDPNGLTSLRDARAEWWRERQSVIERFAATDEVAYSHNVNAAESFHSLGKLLANMEQRLRSFVDGTAEEQLIGTKRYSEETRELSTAAAEAVAAFKRQVYAEGEKYKERLNASDD